MSTTDPRAEYRRRAKHRQTTVIGGTLVVLAVITIVSLMIWTGLVPAPYEPGFATPTPISNTHPEPCPPDGATTANLTSFPVNVYNGTDIAGLAGGVADRLTDAGLNVAQTADYPRGSWSGDVQILAGRDGLANAYSLARAFDTVVKVQIDASVADGDATVSIVLGDGYSQTVKSVDNIAGLAEGEPITAPQACVSVEEAIAAAANQG